MQICNGQRPFSLVETGNSYGYIPYIKSGKMRGDGWDRVKGRRWGLMNECFFVVLQVVEDCCAEIRTVA